MFKVLLHVHQRLIVIFNVRPLLAWGFNWVFNWN